MAKGQQRSNREPKKPKQAKPKPVAAGSPLSTIPSKPSPPLMGKKR
jgi:hypothetical protein